MSIDTPSALEIENAVKIQDFLSTIDGISFRNEREDIFIVSNEDGLDCMVDVEENIVCLAMSVCDLSEIGDTNPEAIPEIMSLLLNLNGEAVHGKFATQGSMVVCKDNLEFENLDKNEFEASLGWIFLNVARVLPAIQECIG